MQMGPMIKCDLCGASIEHVQIYDVGGDSICRGCLARYISIKHPAVAKEYIDEDIYDFVDWATQQGYMAELSPEEPEREYDPDA